MCVCCCACTHTVWAMSHTHTHTHIHSFGTAVWLASCNCRRRSPESPSPPSPFMCCFACRKHAYTRRRYSLPASPASYHTHRHSNARHECVLLCVQRTHRRCRPPTSLQAFQLALQAINHTIDVMPTMNVCCFACREHTGAAGHRGQRQCSGGEAVRVNNQCCGPAVNAAVERLLG